MFIQMQSNTRIQETDNRLLIKISVAISLKMPFFFFKRKYSYLWWLNYCPLITMMSITIFPRQKTDSAICGGSINAPPLVILFLTISPREKIVLSQAAQLMLTHYAALSMPTLTAERYVPPISRTLLGFVELCLKFS